MNDRQNLLSYLQDSFRRNGPHGSSWRIGDNKRIVLFLHGIQGSPSQFQWLVESLPDDVDYINLLLPGHGGTVKAFRRHGRAEWEQAVQSLLDYVLPVYEQIDLVGHSMGCLLWLFAHARQPGRFHSMLFISCPFALRPTIRYLRNNLLALYDFPTKNPYVQATREANSLSSRNPLSYLFCFKPYADLLRMILSARKVQPMPPENGAAYVGQKDEIVSPKSLSIAASKGFDTGVLPLCGHNYFTPEAKARIQENFLRMISQSK